MNDDNEKIVHLDDTVTEEELKEIGEEAVEIGKEATALSAAVGYLTSGLHPYVCVTGLLAVAAHHAQHGEIGKDSFLELAETMWKTAQQTHSSACQSGMPDTTRKRTGQH